MKMKKFINAPETITDEELTGLGLAYPDILDVDGHLVISKDLADADRVTIVTYGGSGHEPAQAGFVGKGMLDVQAVGDIFAAPNDKLVFDAMKLADKGHGVLLLTLNYAGDQLAGKQAIKLAQKAGLERIDLVIPPLIPHVDVLMGTRGVIRSCIPPAAQTAKCVRVTYDSTVLFEDMSNGGGFACDIENAIQMNADCMAVQTFIGAPGESRSLELLARTADAGARYGIPTLGVVAVGKDMERTERFFQLATRVLAENGANVVKSYYCEGFERVAAACPVPIVIVGGKKLPEPEALEMAYQAIQEGAHGVDMGRNIFQSDCPAGMAQAIAKVVHEGYTVAQAFEVYKTVKHQR